MSKRSLHLLSVSIADVLGGGERMAWDLFRAYQARGHHSWLAVGTRYGTDPQVLPFPDLPRGRWFRFCRALHARLQREPARRRTRWLKRLQPWLWDLAEPGKWLDRIRGLHDYRFPATWRLLDLPPQRPDLVHCHNLHCRYFDLRALPWLSRQVPVVLSLHDAWLLAGLCEHSFDCERWRTGCGRCPYFATWVDPAAWFDGTAANWRRNCRIFARSRLHVTTACRWLMTKAEASILAPAMVERRVIPYGVDLARFQPGDQQAVRARLGLPSDAWVLLTVGHGLRGNPCKDFGTLHEAMHRVPGKPGGRRIIVIARGEDAPPEWAGRVEMRFVPWRRDDTEVVASYQAADLYVHPAREDTFPLAVLEALACGVPVVATAVGGIPEQVKSLSPVAGGTPVTGHDAAEATGLLVPASNPAALAQRIAFLLNEEILLRRLGQNARRNAQDRFDLQRQVAAYLAWYEEILASSPP